MKRWFSFSVLLMVFVFSMMGCSNSPVSIDTKDSDLATDQQENGGIRLSALSDEWRYAVYREACYALSSTRYNQGRWGESTKTYVWYGTWFAGDWDYVNSNPSARDAIYDRYNGNVGTWGYSGGYGRGGHCKVFADLVLYRGTDNRYRLPSGYSYASGDIRWVRPGDIIQGWNSNWSIPHTAICVAILARDNQGGATQIDVIDSNFIGGMGSYLIAKHKLPSGSYPLSNFKVW